MLWLSNLPKAHAGKCQSCDVSLGGISLALSPPVPLPALPRVAHGTKHEKPVTVASTAVCRGW